MAVVSTPYLRLVYLKTLTKVSIHTLEMVFLIDWSWYNRQSYKINKSQIHIISGILKQDGFGQQACMALLDNFFNDGLSWYDTNLII